MKRIILFVSIVLAAGVAAIWLAIRLPSDADQSATTQLTVQLQWEPSAQFLGFYVAKARQLYARAGLDVRFLHGGPNVDPISNVDQGNAQVGLGTADQVLKWQASHDAKPLRAFGTVFTRSLAVFMVHQDAAITEPSQLRGKRVGVFPSYDTGSLLKLLALKEGIQETEITVVNFPNFANFERRELDAFGAYLINEPVLAVAKGIPVSIIDPAKSGFRFYSDTLIAKRQYFEQNQDTIRRFVVASAEGWELAKADVAKAMEDMRKEVGSLFGPGQAWDHQRMVGNEVVKYVGGRGRDVTMFGMERAVWLQMETDLFTIGEVQRRGVVDGLCDFAFVGNALGEPK